MELKDGLLFNQMSEYYDQFRPGYPNAIVETILKRVHLNNGANVLEIGSGSGKATAQLVGHDFELVCVEPGKDLAARCRDRFKDHKVSVIVSRFEDCRLPAGTFDAIVSAQAFHWVEKPKGLEQCAKLLKSGGFLMPFWNIEILYDTELDRELLEIMTQYDAFTATLPYADYEKRVIRLSAELAQNGWFAPPELVQVKWEKTYTAEEYFGFVMTGNEFIKNTDQKKQACYDALKALSKKHNGIHRKYICELYIARKSDAVPAMPTLPCQED